MGCSFPVRLLARVNAERLMLVPSMLRRLAARLF
jgi:hypothetical protein